MQTAVNYIKEELSRLGLLDRGQVMTNIFEQAKEMEKQEKIKLILMWDIHTTLKEEDKGCMSEIEKFVAETYGSKGSDETQDNKESSIALACRLYREQLKNKQ